jgi:hypothetical protein
MQLRISRVLSRRLAASVALLFGAAGPALAWDAAGHETIGAIADQLIAGRRAATQVHNLLKPGESLQSIATWADCAKGHCAELTEEMREFVHRNPRHAHYHYTDVPFQALAYDERGVGTSDEDVVHILRQCIFVLKGQAGRDTNPHNFTPREALLLLAHLMGDLHQPLHVGVAYVSDKNVFVVPQSAQAIDGITIFSTYGDNDLLLNDRPLHAFWDTCAVEDAMRRARARTAQELAASLMQAAPDMPIVTGDVTKWPARWATETLGSAKSAHAGLSIDGRIERFHGSRETRALWVVLAPADYEETAAALTAAQLTRAGYRLAAVLEAVWH